MNCENSKKKQVDSVVKWFILIPLIAIVGGLAVTWKEVRKVGAQLDPDIVTRPADVKATLEPRLERMESQLVNLIDEKLAVIPSEVRSDVIELIGNVTKDYQRRFEEQAESVAHINKQVNEIENKLDAMRELNPDVVIPQITSDTDEK